MKGRFAILLLLTATLALLGITACTAPAAQEPEAAAPTPFPEAMATRAPATDTRAPAMEPPPLADFNEQWQSIDEAWNLVHDDFDRWRAGLTMCHPAAMTEALSGFAIEFSSVTEETRGLTRTKTTGKFADKMITAAEKEEAAFRELRDRWQPGNVSRFENVEIQRNLAAKAQREARDQSLALRAQLEEATDPADIAEFEGALEGVESDIGEAHSDYKKLKDDAEDMEASEINSELKDLTEALESVAESIDELPSLKGSRDAVRALEKAIKAEIDVFDNAEAEEPEDEDEDEDEDAEVKLPNFKKIDSAVKASDQALDKMVDVVHDLAVDDPAEALADLTLFDTEYDRLLQSWDRFHSDYNAWRADDGGCDRLQVLESLTEFSGNVDAVGNSVRSLPKSGYLEPVHRLMVEAIATEEQAFRSLRDTWQPFTLDALRAVDRARTMSDTRRSDADIIILELENRF